MPAIENAPGGEKTSSDGTEKLGIGDTSQWMTSARIVAYARTLVQTLLNKTIDLANNTLIGTLAQFNAAVSDADLVSLAGSETLTNKTLTAPVITAPSITTTFGLMGDISPSQITSNQNDYNPTGLSTATVLRLNSDASRNITGLQGGADGRIIVIHNVGSFDIVLKDSDAGSSAGNRFALSGDITLAADDGCTLMYDSTSSRWRCMGKSPGGGSGSVSDAAYGSGWDGDTTTAPSKNAVYDQIESIIAGSGAVDDTVYGSGWNGDTTHAPSKNTVYDKIESLAAGSGAVVAVKSVSKTDTQTITTINTSFTDISGLSITYTPTNASNKILVRAVITIGGVVSVSGGLARLVRDSTAIGVGTSVSSRAAVGGGMNAGGSNDGTGQIIIEFEDSPGDTSSHTWKAQASCATGAGSGSVFINRSNNDTDAGYSPRGICSLTIMEVTP